MFVALVCRDVYDVLSPELTESVLAILQDQILPPNDFGGNGRIMKAIKGTISILSALSATVALGWLPVWYVRRR